MKLNSIKKDKIFIPEFNENKKLPDSEQVKVEIKHFPTTVEANTYKKFKSDVEGGVEIKYNDSLMLLQCVGRIHNLEIGNKAIKTGEDIAKSSDLRLNELITDIRNYLLHDGSDFDEGEGKA